MYKYFILLISLFFVLQTGRAQNKVQPDKTIQSVQKKMQKSLHKTGRLGTKTWKATKQESKKIYKKAKKTGKSTLKKVKKEAPKKWDTVKKSTKTTTKKIKKKIHTLSK